jgi:hypothetical protein
MSVSSYVRFYSTVKPADPRAWVRQIIGSLKVQRTGFVFRARDDLNWEYLRLMNDPNVLEEPTRPPSETLGEGLPLQDLPSLYREGWCLGAELLLSNEDFSLWRGIERAIPVSIRDNHVPSSVTLYVGVRDIIATDWRTGDHVLAGRAWCSLDVWGYSSPHEPAEFQRMLLEVPEFKALRAGVEAVVGPMEVVFDLSC